MHQLWISQMASCLSLTYLRKSSTTGIAFESSENHLLDAFYLFTDSLKSKSEIMINIVSI